MINLQTVSANIDINAALRQREKARRLQDQAPRRPYIVGVIRNGEIKIEQLPPLGGADDEEVTVL